MTNLTVLATLNYNAAENLNVWHIPSFDSLFCFHFLKYPFVYTFLNL